MNSSEVCFFGIVLSVISLMYCGTMYRITQDQKYAEYMAASGIVLIVAVFVVFVRILYVLLVE